MSWICPECQRPFKHENQWHSCVKVDPGLLFENKDPLVKKIYGCIYYELKKFGKDIRITAAKNAVFAKAPSTFAAFKPKKKALSIEFLLREEVNEFPIEKTLRISKNRVAHSLHIESPEEVDRQLLNWLRQAYETVKEKKSLKNN